MTAYDLRISDWSSDGCSSDLPGLDIAAHPAGDPRQAVGREAEIARMAGAVGERGEAGVACERGHGRIRNGRGGSETLDRNAGRGDTGRRRRRTAVGRSEEHTSELQSLMRISYAVFCLKKKKTRARKP